MTQDNLQTALRDFHRLGEVRERSQDDSLRISEQPKVVSRFYDVVTKFYEIGWGTCFHFSPRRAGERLADSQQRHDREIGELLGLKPGMRVADIGCGIGGPLVVIANATGASVTGINFNAYQIRRGEERVRRAGLSDTCDFLYANFMDIPLEDGTFDAMYSFEAVCHAPNNGLLFQELYRLLKPGGEVAIVDWCLTDAFQRGDRRHEDLRARIERTNATPDLPMPEEYVDAVRGAGFEIIRAVDQQAEQGDPERPWYMALEGRDFSLSSIARIPAGRAFTVKFTRALEALRIVPAGTSESASFLNVAADALVESGKLGIFTPSFLVHARRPKAD